MWAPSYKNEIRVKSFFSFLLEFRLFFLLQMSYAGERRLLSRFADGPLSLFFFVWIFSLFFFFINITYAIIIPRTFFSCPNEKKEKAHVFFKKKGDFCVEWTHGGHSQGNYTWRCFMLISKWIKEGGIQIMSYAKIIVYIYRPAKEKRMKKEKRLYLFIWLILFVSKHTIRDTRI